TQRKASFSRTICAGCVGRLQVQYHAYLGGKPLCADCFPPQLTRLNRCKTFNVTFYC
ncbi:hypothetical protein BV25DRAFT_1831551, partial [Artomyces pyxidatus]